MVFFGFSPREKYSVTNAISANSLRFTQICKSAMCLFYNNIGSPSGITKYCKEVYTLAEKSDQGGRRKIADLLRYYKTNIFS